MHAIARQKGSDAYCNMASGSFSVLLDCSDTQTSNTRGTCYTKDTSNPVYDTTTRQVQNQCIPAMFGLSTSAEEVRGEPVPHRRMEPGGSGCRPRLHQVAGSKDQLREDQGRRFRDPRARLKPPEKIRRCPNGLTVRGTAVPCDAVFQLACRETSRCCVLPAPFMSRSAGDDSGRHMRDARRTGSG